MEVRQIPLQLYLPKHCRLDNFISLHNQTMFTQLQHWLSKPQTVNTALYLWGGAGVGKSHLLAASCHWASGHGLTCGYVSLREVRHYGPDLVADFHSLACVALDDIQQVAGDPAWELALFSLLNSMMENECKLIIAATQPPRGLAWQLNDLQSRLSASTVFHVQPLDDDGKRLALQQYAHDRDMPLSDEVISYLFRHYCRDMHTLNSVLEKLDMASLSEGRRITVPFVKSVLGEQKA